MFVRALRGLICRDQRGQKRRGFSGDDGGSTIIEFALLAPIFFFTLLAVFEVGMMFGSSVMVETAAKNGARAVRTGRIYEATAPALDVNTQKALFEEALCSETALIDCADLSYDVRVFSNFASANTDVYCGPDGRIASPNFDIGLPQQIVVVTVFYTYSAILPLPGVSARSYADGGCGAMVLSSTMVFRNEPFPQTVAAAP